MIDGRNIVELDAMGEHGQRIGFAVSDHLEDCVPVFVHGGLAVADEADSALHYGADVEVVGLWEFGEL